ncbi:MAG TPA: carboxypeptidase regulatory-like domain-containing protein [Streptosporangiaceae bacterium]
MTGRWNRRLAAGLTGAAVAAVSLASSLTVLTPAAAEATPAAAAAQYTPAGCDAPPPAGARSDVAQCFALIKTNRRDQIQANVAGPLTTALGPADIQSAYDLPAAGGAGMTVAVVDAFGYDNAEADLATFRSYYGLPACTTQNGCFTKVDQSGGASYPADNSGWAEETALDLDAVSSACPLCHVLLVEGNSTAFDDLGTAVDTAVRLGAQFVSNSYGIAGEDPAEASLDHYYDHPGTVVTAATGDSGGLVSYPASSPDVTAVGGTTLTRDASAARGWTESAWASGGAGCSAYEPRPAYQQPVSADCPGNRATADIAADANPSTGLSVFDTDQEAGWMQVGGTSLSAPLMAAMYALAGPPAAGTYPVTYPYDDPSQSGDLHDVASGSDGTCGTLLCTAGPGWDGPTGLGTPNGVSALTFGPHGAVAGTVITGHHSPLASASVTATNTATAVTYSATTGSAGTYNLPLPVGSYNLAVHSFGYAAVTVTDLTVTADSTMTRNFTLTPQSERTLSGTVTDGSGHGWPMYAKITVAGDPDPAFTDPRTGRYRLRLPVNSSYQLQVSAAGMPGYQTTGLTVRMGRSSRRRDAVLTADPQACTAPGYAFQYTGLRQGFTGWQGTTPQGGWTSVDNTGSDELWEFSNPRNRAAPPGGDASFAIVDSASYSYKTVQNTSLVSPVTDLSGQAAPHIGFDTSYSYYFGAAIFVDLSLDGGATWTNVWKELAPGLDGHIDIPVPQAADQKDVRVRFTYTGHTQGWWAIDNVYAGTRTCLSVPGGLVEGFIRDRATGKPIADATVSSAADAADTGVSITTPDDPRLPDGFYTLFSSHTGNTGLTAGASGYVVAHATVRVAAGRIRDRSWSLAPSRA